eukprot:CAMPEP_0168577636 /NCGR_PEP_ID=MMETSP0413-20121227/20893_1 /TAXON_ID=136452 /ORGANISM="Filamoeba nolandi, Strain NC-AS-23-1" /LENGTH=480 /DNA_ID=CAMNT_0008611405 /DNA_START=471 /DNA_END=1913 /DNA_ORIENTATION=+
MNPINPQDLSKGNADGGSSYMEQYNFFKKQQQLWAEITKHSEKHQKEIHESATKRFEALGKKYQELGPALEKEFREKGEQLKLEHEKKWKELEEEAKTKTTQMQQHAQKEIEAAMKTGDPQKVLAKQHEIQQQSLKLEQAHMEKIARFQRDALEANQKLQTDAMQRQQQLEKEYQEEESQLKKDIEKEVELLQQRIQEKIQLGQQMLEPDPRFASTTLTDDQKLEFMRKGFLKIENVVPKKMISDAVRMINYGLSQGFKKEEIASFRRPEIEGSEAITNLILKTPLLWYIRRLIGKTQPCYGGQIALRFPGHFCYPDMENPLSTFPFKAAENWSTFWHIDGLPTPESGVPEGQVHNFTILVGVLLSDLPEPMSGNLALYPGSHVILQDHFKKVGADKLVKEGLPKIELPEPVQITGKMGDVVLVHYQTAHNVAPNLSPHIRYAVYFRLMSDDHPASTFRAETITDIWKDWEGLQHLRDKM